jgi:glycosyltransferase involved in cell wall biosynthesis
VRSFGIHNNVHLLGNRSDTERILPALDVFCLTSRMEANPVSILEALSCGVPVVAPDVGSISEAVIHGETGYLTKPLCEVSTSEAILALLDAPAEANKMGRNGRLLVSDRSSLDHMVLGYEKLISSLYNSHRIHRGLPEWQRPPRGVETLGQSLLDEAYECQQQTEGEIAPG